MIFPESSWNLGWSKKLLSYVERRALLDRRVQFLSSKPSNPNSVLSKNYNGSLHQILRETGQIY
jgi:hypothetical protein